MKLKKLKIDDLQNVNGGSFGYDVGWLLHYAWDCLTNDIPGQMADITTYNLNYSN